MGLASARAKDGTLYWAQVFGDSDTTPKAFQEGLACPEGFAPVRVPATRDGVVRRWSATGQILQRGPQDVLKALLAGVAHHLVE